MPFQISELQESDIPDFVELDDLAMSGWPVATAYVIVKRSTFRATHKLTHVPSAISMDLAAQNSGAKSRKEMIAGVMQKAFENKNPNGIWLKATDVSSGRLVAAAAWTWHLEDTFIDRPPATNTEGTDDDNIFIAMRAMWQDFRKEFFVNQKWYHLEVLCTHPDWQRRGAGSMLVQYGCDKADEAGVICTLQATEAGLGLYLNNGFHIVKEKQFDLRRYGVDATELRRWMIRKPQA